MEVNFIETIVNLLSPDKRKPTTIAFLSPIGTEIQVNSDALQFVYRESGSYNDWTGTTTYNQSDVVKYGKAVYLSTVNDNLNNTPVFSEAWVKLTNNFIGADERVFYNGTKLIFDYAINTFFGTLYNPNTTMNSEIYIQTYPVVAKAFTVTSTELFCDSVYKDRSTGNIRQTNAVPDQFNAIIWVLGLNTPGKPTTAEIKTFADKYITAGVIYKIQNY